MERKGGRHHLCTAFKKGTPSKATPLAEKTVMAPKQKSSAFLFVPARAQTVSPPLPSTMCKPDSRRKTGHHHHHQSPARDTGVYHRLSAARLGVGRRTSPQKHFCQRRRETSCLGRPLGFSFEQQVVPTHVRNENNPASPQWMVFLMILLCCVSLWIF